jgi:DNA-directed RNA polymerase alpha subunit
MIEQAITLTLTRRAINALVAEITLDQLKTGHYSAANLMGVPNLGIKSINDIREYLQKWVFY